MVSHYTYIQKTVLMKSAFDSSGRHYDETGNYTDWWDDKTIAAFEERAQCFIDQYSKFTVTGPNLKPLHVNGRLTLGENIADAGGISATFHAWKKREDASPDPVLPGLSRFSKEQLFFISYGNWWCSKTSPEAAEGAIYSDPHAPKPARIIVSYYHHCQCHRHYYLMDANSDRGRWRTRESLRKRFIVRVDGRFASFGRCMNMIHHYAYAYTSTLACDVYHYCQNNAVVDNCRRE